MMEPSKPLYGLRLVSTGVAVVALGLASMVQTFGATIGPFEFMAERGVASATCLAVVSVGEAEECQKRWSARLGAMLPLHFEDEVAGAIAKGCGAVLLDGVPIDATDLERLASFEASGGGVGLLGVRAGHPEAAHPLTALAGVEVMRVPDALGIQRKGNGALAAGLQPWERVHVLRDTRRVAAAAPAAELKWSEGVSPESGAAGWRGEPRGGRLAWLAVRPDAVLNEASERRAMDRIVLAMVAWLARRPFAEAVSFDSPELVVGIVPGGPRRFVLSLTNRADWATPELAFRVHLNRPTAGVDVGLTTIELSGRHAFRATRVESGVFTLTVPPLEGGSSRSYTLDVAEEAA